MNFFQGAETRAKGQFIVMQAEGCNGRATCKLSVRIFTWSSFASHDTRLTFSPIRPKLKAFTLDWKLGSRSENADEVLLNPHPIVLWLRQLYSHNFSLIKRIVLSLGKFSLSLWTWAQELKASRWFIAVVNLHSVLVGVHRTNAITLNIWSRVDPNNNKSIF
jgi:hypothetical protein